MSKNISTTVDEDLFKRIENARKKFSEETGVSISRSKFCKKIIEEYLNNYEKQKIQSSKL